jgi:hypothetical protein
MSHQICETRESSRRAFFYVAIVMVVVFRTGNAMPILNIVILIRGKSWERISRLSDVVEGWVVDLLLFVWAQSWQRTALVEVLPRTQCSVVWLSTNITFLDG